MIHIEAFLCYKGVWRAGGRHTESNLGLGIFYFTFIMKL